MSSRTTACRSGRRTGRGSRASQAVTRTNQRSGRLGYVSPPPHWTAVQVTGNTDWETDCVMPLSPSQVGFYSLFSVTEEPWVESGETFMGFYWKNGGDQVRTSVSLSSRGL